MRKLLSANLQRLWISKSFWITVLLMVFTEAFFCYAMSRYQPIPMDVVTFISLQCLGIFVSVFISLFFGTEYGDGTIRNKITVGHTRSNIYLASFTTAVIAITIVFFAEVITGTVLGALLYEAPAHTVTQLILAGVVGWFACISFSAIFTLIGMLFTNKALTSTINILTAFFLLFLGVYNMQMLSYPTTVGMERQIHQFLFELNPAGQILHTMSIDIANPWKLMVFALVFSCVLTGAGICFFKRKDLK